MNRRASGVVLVGAATAAVALSGGFAWADWTIGSSPGTATAKAAQIPAMRAPKVELPGGSPKIVWIGLLAAQADHYVVIRGQGIVRVVVCTVPASVTSCPDPAAPPGATVVYSVHATLGGHWVGKDSENSRSVKVPPKAAPAASTTAPAEALRTIPTAAAPPAPADSPTAQAVRSPVEAAPSSAPPRTIEPAPATTEPAPKPSDPSSAPST